MDRAPVRLSPCRWAVAAAIWSRGLRFPQIVTPLGGKFHALVVAVEQLCSQQGFGDFGIHCISRTPGVLGWLGIVPLLAKYVFNISLCRANSI